MALGERHNNLTKQVVNCRIYYCGSWTDLQTLHQWPGCSKPVSSFWCSFSGSTINNNHQYMNGCSFVLSMISRPQVPIQTLELVMQNVFGHCHRHPHSVNLSVSLQSSEYKVISDIPCFLSSNILSLISSIPYICYLTTLYLHSILFCAVTDCFTY